MLLCLRAVDWVGSSGLAHTRTPGPPRNEVKPALRGTIGIIGGRVSSTGIVFKRRKGRLGEKDVGRSQRPLR